MVNQTPRLLTNQLPVSLATLV